MVNMNNLMKQAQAMQKKMADAQEEMANKEYTGTSGGGSIEIIISGKGALKKLKIDSSIVDKDETEVLEDLIIAAFNDAKKKADEDSEGSMSGLMGGMNLPPGFKMPF